MAITTAERYRKDPVYREKQKKWSRTYNRRKKIDIQIKKFKKEMEEMTDKARWYKNAKKIFFQLTVEFSNDTKKSIANISIQDFIYWLGKKYK